VGCCCCTTTSRSTHQHQLTAESGRANGKTQNEEKEETKNIVDVELLCFIIVQ